MSSVTRNTEAPKFDSTGWCQSTKLTCHTRLMKWVDEVDAECLEFIRNDCRAATAALPEGAKAGHYQDTAHYCSARLRKIQGK